MKFTSVLALALAAIQADAFASQSMHSTGALSTKKSSFVQILATQDVAGADAALDAKREACKAKKAASAEAATTETSTRDAAVEKAIQEYETMVYLNKPNVSAEEIEANKSVITISGETKSHHTQVLDGIANLYIEYFGGELATTAANASDLAAFYALQKMAEEKYSERTGLKVKLTIPDVLKILRELREQSMRNKAAAAFLEDEPEAAVEKKTKKGGEKKKGGKKKGGKKGSSEETTTTTTTATATATAAPASAMAALTGGADITKGTTDAAVSKAVTTSVEKKAAAEGVKVKKESSGFSLFVELTGERI